MKHSSASSVSQYVALSGYLGLHTSMLSLLTSALSDLKSMNLRQLLLQLVSLGLIVTSALVIWKSLMLVTGSDSPVVVVLSGSMAPAFYQGDVLFLYLAERATRVGEIVVFNIKGREIPIVHRVTFTFTFRRTPPSSSPPCARSSPPCAAPPPPPP